MVTEVKTLDVTQPAKVRYCIETWLRDEQIRVNIKRVTARIAPSYERRTDPAAVVCFGPSLRETWELVKDFRYVISCSGSHKFLVEHGIIPSWHVEVDPRAHKVALIGQPQAETEYLIASACHPKVLDHLDGFNVKLWHVFDNTEDGHRLLPRGEWAITGGCDVGLRALTIAAFLGFRDLHVFGMDHSAGTIEQPTDRRHADAHPNGAMDFAACPVDGVNYRTTPSMLAAATQVKHELQQMPSVTAKFYGEGLCQALMRDYQQPLSDEKRPLADTIAARHPELISAEYAALNSQLHRENLSYGVRGNKHAPVVIKLCTQLNTTSVLDYGCGKGYLAKSLDFPIWEYDPAIPEKSQTPRPADIVVCTDVLEHIEPDKILYVLDDLRRCVRKVGYFVIHTGPAMKTLPDGRNTHLIQKGDVWWRKKLEKFFMVGSIIQKGPELYVVVGPKVKR